MDTYSVLREFADSWALLALFLFFLGVVLRVFRPSVRDAHRDAAEVPFRNDNHPAEDAQGSETEAEA